MLIKKFMCSQLTYNGDEFCLFQVSGTHMWFSHLPVFPGVSGVSVSTSGAADMCWVVSDIIMVSLYQFNVDKMCNGLQSESEPRVEW